MFCLDKQIRIIFSIKSQTSLFLITKNKIQIYGFFQVIFHLNYFLTVKRKKMRKLLVCFHVFSHKLLKVSNSSQL
jgi:heme/copper-type cytochrome/quinol oxidase subunit 4